mmetsp:Transcript_14652/g.40726  ORF Transcript_14652/g.40726 Transcript_14652/m.40726 type:complete len:207 (+) Transcript_14652:1091-1711(+)
MVFHQFCRVCFRETFVNRLVAVVVGSEMCLPGFFPFASVINGNFLVFFDIAKCHKIKGESCLPLPAPLFDRLFPPFRVCHLIVCGPHDLGIGIDRVVIDVGRHQPIGTEQETAFAVTKTVIQQELVVNGIVVIGYNLGVSVFVGRVPLFTVNSEYVSFGDLNEGSRCHDGSLRNFSTGKGSSAGVWDRADSVSNVVHAPPVMLQPV